MVRCLFILTKNLLLTQTPQAKLCLFITLFSNQTLSTVYILRYGFCPAYWSYLFIV